MGLSTAPSLTRTRTGKLGQGVITTGSVLIPHTQKAAGHASLFEKFELEGRKESPAPQVGLQGN